MIHESTIHRLESVNNALRRFLLLAYRERRKRRDYAQFLSNDFKVSSKYTLPEWGGRYCTPQASEQSGYPGWPELQIGTSLCVSQPNRAIIMFLDNLAKLFVFENWSFSGRLKYTCTQQTRNGEPMLA